MVTGKNGKDSVQQVRVAEEHESLVETSANTQRDEKGSGWEHAWGGCSVHTPLGMNPHDACCVYEEAQCERPPDNVTQQISRPAR